LDNQNDEIKREISESGKHLSKIKQPTSESVQLFVSFDLTNSTEYKVKNPADWVIVFNNFYSSIDRKIKDEKYLSLDLQIWKFVGDEVLLVKNVGNISEIWETPIKIFEMLNIMIKELEAGVKAPKGTLSIKATLWMAKVTSIQSGSSISDIKESGKRSTHYNIRTGLVQSEYDYSSDFLGEDIDLGFRIAKYSSRARLAISANIAFILLQNKEKIEKTESEFSYKPEKVLKIVSFKELRGVWGSRKYPVIWFDTAWDDPNMFLYDEEYTSDIIKNIKNGFTQKDESKISYLYKVLEDLYLTEKYNELQNFILGLKKQPESLTASVHKKTFEFHCPAICVTETGGVLIAKRPGWKKYLPNRWEFGCGQVSALKTIKQCIEDDYQKDFGARLIVDEEPVPIASYRIEREDKIFPGIIFLARLSNPEEILAKKKFPKHSEVRVVSLTELNDIPKDDCVPNFHKNAKIAVDRLQNL